VSRPSDDITASEGTSRLLSFFENSGSASNVDERHESDTRGSLQTLPLSDPAKKLNKSSTASRIFAFLIAEPAFFLLQANTPV
jgi:hypothetical protein